MRAGWYPSEARPGEERYWTGAGWSKAFSNQGVSREHNDAYDEPPPTTPFAPVNRLLWQWIVAAVIFVLVATVISLILDR